MTQRLLNDELGTQVHALFQSLKEPVEILFFGSQHQSCELCAETSQLLHEVVGLSDKLGLHVYDLEQDAEVAAQYGIDKAPAFLLASKQGDELLDHGIRYIGMPAGHEFTSLVNDLLLVSSRDSALSADTRAFLDELTQPLHLQVFVTPTCPYCPRAVVLAHQLALQSKWVTAEMVEATEFPELADRYQVSGVPHTSINHGAWAVIGSAPEEMLIAEIRKMLSGQPQTVPADEEE